MPISEYCAERHLPVVDTGCLRVLECDELWPRFRARGDQPNTSPCLNERGSTEFQGLDARASMNGSPVRSERGSEDGQFKREGGP